MNRLLPILPMICALLAGCANKQVQGDLSRREPTPVHETYARAFGEKLPPPRDVTPPAEARGDGASLQPRAEIVELKHELAASSNQTQQSLDGLGVLIGKLGETVKLAELNVPIKVQQQLDAFFSMQNTANAQAWADFKASIKIENEQHAQAIATFQAKLDALAAAQVGFQNQLQQTSQTVSTGAGSAVRITQFSADMAALMARSYDSMVNTVLIVVGAYAGIVAILARSNNRSVETLAHLAAEVDGDDKKTKRLPPKGVPA